MNKSSDANIPTYPPCVVCKTDTSRWDDNGRELHGAKMRTVVWEAPAGSKIHTVDICYLCWEAIRSMHVAPFIEQHHQPLRDRMEKIRELAHE